MCQKGGAVDFVGFAFKDPHEFFADDFALALGVTDPGEGVEEFGAGVDGDEFDAHLIAEGVDDLFGFVEAEQAVVDKNTGEVVTNCFVDEQGRHGRIDPTR